MITDWETNFTDLEANEVGNLRKKHSGNILVGNHAVIFTEINSPRIVSVGNVCVENGILRPQKPERGHIRQNQQVLNPTPLNPTPATCHQRKRKLRCSFRNAALQKLHCNIGFSAMRKSFGPNAALQQTKNCTATSKKLRCRKVALSCRFPAGFKLPRFCTHVTVSDLLTKLPFYKTALLFPLNILPKGPYRTLFCSLCGAKCTKIAPFHHTSRAQRLKKIKILKFSSEVENFKWATHQGPYSVGWEILEVEIVSFNRDWSFQARLKISSEIDIFQCLGPLG